MMSNLKQCVSFLLGCVLVILSFPVFAENGYGVTVEYQETDKGYLVNGKYNYNGDKELMAILAVYNINDTLKSVSMKEITGNTDTETISYMYADEGCTVKGMLWKKGNMEPIADAVKKIIMPSTEPTESPTIKPSTEPTVSPTIAPSTEPTESPTITPSAEPTESPTTSPEDNKKAYITIKYVDEENNKLKDDIVLEEDYTDGEVYIVPDYLKTDFAVKNSDGLYNLYNINNSTSQLSAKFENQMSIVLKFNSGVQYDYYEDFENYTVDTNKWHGGSGAAQPTVETDSTEYIKHTTGSSTTGGYLAFDAIDTTEKFVTVTADVKFTQPTGSKKGNSQFTISSSSPTFSNNNINWGINSTLDGHIVGLEYNGGSTFYVNGQTADTEFINDWIHIKSEMDFSKKIVKITLTNDNGKNAEYTTDFYSNTVDSNIGSIYLRSAGANGSISVDNLTIRITGDAGPVKPTIESVLNYKSIYAFGDSIVYGHTAPKKSFMQLIANDYSMQLNMMAKNGATVMSSGNQILTQINSAPAETPDFIVFDGYTNDAYGSDGGVHDVTQCYGEITDDGVTEFDLDTFCGSFENIIYTMKQKWPTSNIVFITIHKSGARDIEIQTKLHELTVAICEKWNVSVVDIFNDTKLDTTDEEQMKQYMIGGKGSHPNEAACRTFYIPAIVNTLENLCEKAE